ncbi:VrlC virulence-associated protein-like protein [Sinorhizobium phage phiM9]|uniref:VrlC virulence-associated protein-like protein n=1 Tax=Sinorhizobium phage phiM9 TaxID=1636182 RepID=A0A0F6R5Y3_9CAUD|nr:VrlC virulence-associated protein-like protein [Sinorhizobium phage phiM9]AKE44760.1 VrlC virulence-associated protein-like protein [Sinorhizobium phage phiM9]
MTELLNDRYLDDSNENFTRILFRAGYAPQSKELNAIQSSLMRQVSAIGDHLFKDGSMVVGGTIKNAKGKSLLIESTYNGLNVDLESFIGKTIVELDASGAETGARGLVFAVSSETSTDPSCLHYLDENVSASIGEGSTVRVSGTSSFATIRTFEQPVRSCLYARLLGGIFYFNKTFVRVDDQLIVYSKFDDLYSGFVGLQFERNVITEFDDPSLFDSARGYSNFNGAGAHRETYTSKIVSFTFTSERPENFVSLLEIREGEVKAEANNPAYNEIGDVLATRTFDESGDYVVNYFRADLVDKIEIPVVKIEPSLTSALVLQATTAIPHSYSVGDQIFVAEDSIYTGDYKVKEVLTETVFTFETETANTSIEQNKKVYRTDHFGVLVSPGKAYVKGYQVWLPGTTKVEVPKARTTETSRNASLSIGYGRYVVVTTPTGLFDTAAKQQVSLRNAANTAIGTARVHAITRASAGKYNLYLFDIKMNAGQSSALVTNIYAATGANGSAVTAPVSGAFNVRSADSRAMFQQISDVKIATLRPENIDVLSYSTQKLMTVASASNQAVFTLTGTETFLGARSQNIVASSTFLDEYVVVNAAGAVQTLTSATISADGKTLTLVAAAMTGNITISAPVSVTPAVKKKIKKTKTYSTSAVTSSARKYTFDVVDVISATVKNSTGVDVTSMFKFDSGQRDDMYDYGSVTLQSGASIPTSPLSIEIEYFEHSGTGYFSVDSYSGIDFSDIPVYKSEDLQDTYDLTDVIDFRYVKTGASSFASSLTPIPEGLTVIDFDYYLPRKDLVTVSKNGRVNIVQGIPSLTPVYPVASENEMILFKLDIGPYTKDYAEEVFVYPEQNRRYTMKDVGKLDQRISRLEYETSLNALESLAKTADIVDEDGNSRYKTGFLVDNFSGHGIGDTSSSDYRAAIDRQNRVLRPAFKQTAFGTETFEIDGFQRVGNSDIGYFMMLPYTQEVLTENIIASKGVSVNPYLVAKRKGTALLNPSSDYWKDTTSLPVRNVDMTADLDNGIDLGVVWNDWEEAWSGSTSQVSTSRSTNRSGNRTTTTTRTATTTTTRTNEERTGEQTSLDFVDTTQSIGKYVVDVNVSYYMRAIAINFKLSGMRPDTDLHVFIDGSNINSLVTPGLAPKGQGSVRTDSSGNASGKISIPNGRFRTGERLITFSDEPNNVSDNATTEASFTFVSSGLNVTNQETTISTSVPQLVSTPVNETRTNVSVSTNVSSSSQTTVTQFAQSRFRSDNREDNRGSDPLAQSIWVSPQSFPNGAYVTELTLYFKRKPTDTTHPLVVQLRPSENGYPSSTDIIPYSEVSVPNSQVKIPKNTNDMASIQAAPTVVKFPVPIYVEPGKYFNFVLLSSHSDYEVYVSEMGQRIIGTTINIYKQPVLGSSFRSQNAQTWTAYQNEDVMHGIKICKFSTSDIGKFSFRNQKIDEFKYNVLNWRPQVIKFEDHIVEYTLSTRDSTTSTTVTEKIVEDKNFNLKTERIVRDDTQDIKIAVQARTVDSYTSPLFELNKCYGMLIGNVVNNMGLVRRNFLIVSGGSGYTSNSVITFTGGGGSGAVYKPVVSGGKIVDLIEVNQGSGYTSAPTIAVSGGTGANIVFSGFETSPIDGNADARYVSKVVTLQDDYDADRADVYLDISAPSGTDVKIYYRCKNNSDEQAISAKNWVEVVKNNRKTSVTDEFIETKYEIDLTYTGSNGAVYDASNSVQVKIVLLASNTSIVPKCKNFRLITSV